MSDKPGATIPVACIVCTKPLENAVAGVVELPSGATTFKAYGNFGSGVFDPMGRRAPRLVVNVCDECLTAAGDAGRVLMLQPAEPEPEPTYTAWNSSVEVW